MYLTRFSRAETMSGRRKDRFEERGLTGLGSKCMFSEPRKQPSLRSGASRCWHINVKEAIMNNTQEPQPPDSSRKHKGGRPPLPEEEKHTYCKKAYFTKKEVDCVELAADENRMSDSEYINLMTMNGKVVAPISPEFARDFRAVANLSGNLNQLAHKANLAGYSSVAKELLFERSRLKAVLDKLYSWI